MVFRDYTAAISSSHRDLLVRQKSIQLAITLYKLTEKIPKEEIDGLTSQLRCAGVSIASNIAEGFGFSACSSNSAKAKLRQLEAGCGHPM